eukprot:g12991.t1
MTAHQAKQVRAAAAGSTTAAAADAGGSGVPAWEDEHEQDQERAATFPETDTFLDPSSPSERLQQQQLRYHDFDWQQQRPYQHPVHFPTDGKNEHRRLGLGLRQYSFSGVKLFIGGLKPLVEQFLVSALLHPLPFLGTFETSRSFGKLTSEREQMRVATWVTPRAVGRALERASDVVAQFREPSDWRMRAEKGKGGREVGGAVREATLTAAVESLARDIVFAEQHYGEQLPPPANYDGFQGHADALQKWDMMAMAKVDDQQRDARGTSSTPSLSAAHSTPTHTHTLEALLRVIVSNALLGIGDQIQTVFSAFLLEHRKRTSQTLRMRYGYGGTVPPGSGSAADFDFEVEPEERFKIQVAATKFAPQLLRGFTFVEFSVQNDPAVWHDAGTAAGLKAAATSTSRNLRQRVTAERNELFEILRSFGNELEVAMTEHRQLWRASASQWAQTFNSKRPYNKGYGKSREEEQRDSNIYTCYHPTRQGMWQKWILEKLVARKVDTLAPAAQGPPAAFEEGLQELQTRVAEKAFLERVEMTFLSKAKSNWKSEVGTAAKADEMGRQLLQEAKESLSSQAATLRASHQRETALFLKKWGDTFGYIPDMDLVGSNADAEK